MSEIHKALAYARVSTLDQADSDLSIPAQLKAIRNYAEKNNMEIVEEYIDEGISAFSDDAKRLSFNAMIQNAIDEPEIKYILVHDSTRFFRNKYKSAAIKGELLKHGVSVIPISSPYDPTTIDGLWRESIDEAMAMASSMATSFHTKKCMAENATKRDPGTGYCYKNGGVPPYGYMMKQVLVGKDRRGKDKFKLLWDINPETATILRKIILDMRIRQGLSYDKIRDNLNNQNIPGPNGKLWGTSTLVEIFRENRLRQYSGIYYWNKENHKTPGKRFNDKSEWIEVENAHPAIITVDEVEAALAVTKSRQPRTAAARSYDSRWLLTGLNLEGSPFFICKECGGNIIGTKRDSRHRGKYVCGTHYYKGNKGCTNNLRINDYTLEAKLLAEIESHFGNPDAIDKLINELNSKVEENMNAHNKLVAIKQTELEKVDKQINSTFIAFEKGMDSDLCNERLKKLKINRLEIQIHLDKMKKDQPLQLAIDPQKAYEYFSNLRELFKSGTNEQKRMLYKTYIRRMELDTQNNKLNVYFYPNYLQENLKRGYDNPRHITVGAAEGT